MQTIASISTPCCRNALRRHQKAGVNYHANGYAALMELNALAVHGWKPHDTSGVQSSRLDVQDPFNCCYLYNDENEADVSVSVKTELPDIVASFLFQKIVEIQNIEWGETNTLLRQETFEVGSQAKDPKPPRKENRAAAAPSSPSALSRSLIPKSRFANTSPTPLHGRPYCSCCSTSGSKARVTRKKRSIRASTSS